MRRREHKRDLRTGWLYIARFFFCMVLVCCLFMQAFFLEGRLVDADGTSPASLFEALVADCCCCGGAQRADGACCYRYDCWRKKVAQIFANAKKRVAKKRSSVVDP